MLTAAEVASLLRAAEYFARRPRARIGRDLARARLKHAAKMRRQRARLAAASDHPG